VSQAVWNAYHSLEAANQQLATSATLAKAAATNEEIATGRYQSGVGSILDVLTAQSASANARLIRIQSEFSWQSARAQLAQAVGRLGSADDLDAVAPVEAR
jgi:outer membrane protein TolC